MTAPSASAIVADPDWLPHTFDAGGTALTFVRIPRAERDGLMFLAEEHFAGRFDKATVAAAEVTAALGAASSAEAPLNFIFHTAFCGSTLLVRALDLPGRTVALKEPDVLINLANRLARSDDAANRDRLRLVLRLLARPYAGGEQVIVKPTNFANRMLLPAMALRPDARAVLLYSDLPTLLRSLVKRGMWGRIWARKLYRSVSAWAPVETGFDMGEMFELTDLQVAGLAWLMQVRHFDAAAAELGNRALVVDSADFLAAPAPTLGKVAQLFGISLEADEVAAIAEGPVFSRHSKFADRDYSVAEREAEHDAAIAAHGEEIGMVTRWVEAVASHCGVPLRPGGSRPAA